MKERQEMGENICFIIGAPRSGTTILCDVLGTHPEIESLSEPYFIWDWMSGAGEDDVRTQGDADRATADFIRREFAATLQKSGKRVLLEKTPENCFRVPFMHAVFPKAKWIFLYRDGRDVVASMNTEWVTRTQMVRKRDVGQLYRTARRMLLRQQYWRNRFRALAHEVRNNVGVRPGRLFNKAKWNGRAAWGPRFPGWEQALERADSDVAFNAMQWSECIRFAREGIAQLPQDRVHRVRYENLVADRVTTLAEIFDFLDVGRDSSVGEELAGSSVGKWRKRFSGQEIRTIEKNIQQELMALGYQPVSESEMTS